MPTYLDTRGKSSIAIAICARCSQKFSRTDLTPDPNSPGLYVCKDDLDQLDPWRLPPRPADQITLEWARPDVQLVPGPTADLIDPMQAVLEIAGESATPLNLVVNTDSAVDEIATGTGLVLASGQSSYSLTPGVVGGLKVGYGAALAIAGPVVSVTPCVAWAPNAAYGLGAQVTPIKAIGPDAWGLDIYLFICLVPGLSGNVAPAWTTAQGTVIQDNQVTWINGGLYLP